MPTSKYFVQGIWPRRRLNLIAGASGAGKTRWIIPQLFALIDGRPVLGQPTEPTRVAYVACDRTSEDARDTMADLGCDPTKLFIFSFMDNEIEWRFNKVVEVIPAGTQLTFIEAIGALVEHGKINDYHEVLRFGRTANKAMRTSGSDFMGSTHTPKLKKDEEFKHTRENVFGSAAWPGVCATIAFIEELFTGQRAIHILPRDAEPQKLIYEFNQSGHLIEACQVLGRTLMDRWLTTLTVGTEVVTSVIQAAGERYKLSRATVTRWITDCCDEGKLQQTGRGVYVKRPMQ